MKKRAALISFTIYALMTLFSLKAGIEVFDTCGNRLRVLSPAQLKAAATHDYAYELLDMHEVAKIDGAYGAEAAAGPCFLIAVTQTGSPIKYLAHFAPRAEDLDYFVQWLENEGLDKTKLKLHLAGANFCGEFENAAKDLMHSHQQAKRLVEEFGFRSDQIDSHLASEINDTEFNNHLLSIHPDGRVEIKTHR